MSVCPPEQRLPQYVALLSGHNLVLNNLDCNNCAIPAPPVHAAKGCRAVPAGQQSSRILGQVTCSGVLTQGCPQPSSFQASRRAAY